ATRCGISLATAKFSSPDQAQPPPKATSTPVSTAIGESTANNPYPTAPSSSITVMTRIRSGFHRTATNPEANRMSNPASEPADSTNPAAAGENPTATAVVVTYAPRAFAAADPSAPATASSSSVVFSLRTASDRSGPRSGHLRCSPRGTLAAASSAIPPAMTNTQRQPMVSATPGTAAPASIVAAGSAECSTPNPKPRRRGGTLWVISRFDDGCPSALGTPARHTTASNHTGPVENASSTRQRELTSAARRMPRVAPSRSATQPIARDARAATPKNPAAAAPSKAGPKPRSSRSCTPRPPTRKTGKEPAVTTLATATSTRTGTG